MKKTSIDQLIQTSLDTLKLLDYKKSTIESHQRQFRHLVAYMKLHGQSLYDERIGEKYQFDILLEGVASDSRLKQTEVSINLLNDMLNNVPLRKRRGQKKVYPFPGKFENPIQSFLEQWRIESRPSKQTTYMYTSALSHLAVRMHEDGICPDQLDALAINRFISSLQNTQLRVCLPVRRILRYLFEEKVTKTDLSVPLLVIKCHRAEKLPSLYNTKEIRKMDASIEKSSRVGKRNYAIFLLASRLGLRASDICSLQFNDLDWDRNQINLIQKKTQKNIELPLLSIVGEAIIDYIRNGRPISENKTLFLTALPPYTPISVPGLSGIVSNIIYKAGIDTKGRHHGSHCLRHSLATRMLDQGTTLPIISESLGHSNTQSTMVYLSVDIKGLLRCSLDVPPVKDGFYMQKGGWFYE